MSGDRRTAPAADGAGRRRSTSLRTRILAWYVILLTLATGVTIALERSALLGNLDQRVEAELRQEADEFRRLLGGAAPDGGCNAGELEDGSCDVGRNPETGEPFGADIAAAFDTFLRRSIPGEYETMVTFIGGAYHASSIDTPPIPLQEQPGFAAAVTGLDEDTFGVVDSPVGEVRFLAAPVGTDDQDATFVVAQFIDPQLAQVRESATIAIIANLIVLGVASLLAYLATGRLLRPVRLVTETAMAISESDLSRRIAVEGDDEVSQLAATFNGMLDRLEEAFDSQRQFFDDAGHELRTPITIVRGNLELLPDDPEERARALHIATDELDRMSRMVKDLLTLAKAERPDFLDREAVDLERLVLDVHAKASALAPRQWEVAVGTNATLVADGQRLTQALIQLAENASRHTDVGDRITIGCDQRGTRIVLWVADTGAGVDPADRERIFERFNRGGAPRGSGTGLGLAIVAAIASAHGGEASVSSEPGAGARFELILPLRERTRDVAAATGAGS